jgi:propionate CoA-transferase
VLSQLFRASAARQPGVLTRTGVGTFVDPRLDGGRLNARSARDLLRIVDVGGEDHLLYPAQHFDCALIRGTTADARGNVSLEHEAFPQDMLAIAQAAHNAGGIVIAQVKRLAADSLHSRSVGIPGLLVDYVVVSEAPEQHWMSFGEAHNPAYLGDAGATVDAPSTRTNDASLIVQRRALRELVNARGAVINVGIGIPAGLPGLARAHGHCDFTVTIESGVVGGVAAEELSFGAASQPDAVMQQSSMFDFYTGGGLDSTFLGMLQFDAAGSVNVGRLEDQIFGVGGFIDIAQNTRAVCFLGTFTAGGLQVEAASGKLRIVQEGRVRKLVACVEQVAFNGRDAVRRGQQVLYITERAVFKLQPQGLALCEIAPGIDVERDLRAGLPASLVVPDNVQTMDASLFS